mgnify:CR=1 FL=1
MNVQLAFMLATLRPEQQETIIIDSALPARPQLQEPIPEPQPEPRDVVLWDDLYPRRKERTSPPQGRHAAKSKRRWGKKRALAQSREA